MDEIQALRDRAAWCLEQNRVRYLQGYFSSDRTRMICIYEAPDAESVRRINLQSGLPFDRIWTASSVGT
jgi:hypothetical protein